MPNRRSKNRKSNNKKARSRRARKGLNKVEKKQVKSLVKSAIAQDEEYGYYDPPYQFSGVMNVTGTTMIFSPTQGNNDGFNTKNVYHSNHGIITEQVLSTKQGTYGIETREGESIQIRRMLMQVNCNANPRHDYRKQFLRIYTVRIPVDQLSPLNAGTEINTYFNNLLLSIKLPGQVNSDLSEQVRALRKTYEILDTRKLQCVLSNNGSELVGLKDNKIFMRNCNWRFRFEKSDATGFTEPLNYRLFHIYKWGGYEQTLSADINDMPEFNVRVKYWYTT